MVELALYQPDIAQNLGAVIRLSACLAMPLHIIEPCGFPMDDKRLRRAAMDYYDHAQLIRHADWPAFRHWQAAHARRLLLLTTQADTLYDTHNFTLGDVLLFGRESAGVPPAVHEQADIRLTIPMQSGCRSLNLALSAAMVAGEASRQLRVEHAP